MNYLKAVILGVVQGATEFLPVSSSGHIVLVKKLLHYQLDSGDSVTFTVLLHFGTMQASDTFASEVVIRAAGPAGQDDYAPGAGLL